MSIASSIEWTQSTWNPVTGCTKISAGCAHCYAERMARRLRAMGQANYVNGFRVTIHEHALDLPLRWRKPQTIFVNSMSDLFHDKVPEAFIREVFDVMRRASWHTFQVLTKRAERMETLGRKLDWPPLGFVRCCPLIQTCCRICLTAKCRQAITSMKAEGNHDENQHDKR